jgi:threonine/homoserine/homoserine lactone efflux protein
VSAEESDPLSRMLELSAVFMLMTFVVFVGYGLFAASVRDHVIRSPADWIGEAGFPVLSRSW